IKRVPPLNTALAFLPWDASARQRVQSFVWRVSLACPVRPLQELNVLYKVALLHVTRAQRHETHGLHFPSAHSSLGLHCLSLVHGVAPARCAAASTATHTTAASRTRLRLTEAPHGID